MKPTKKPIKLSENKPDWFEWALILLFSALLALAYTLKEFS
ncbi:hypothetical protein [Helicobacter acinonychis]|uniref:OMP197 n=1 Tax=Helicobacter acinonychis TaxID=212 RepID=A0A1M4NFL3_HELAC|nr:hypothetical protein [Helicobacter acinonychis]SFZ70682.1 OMP197 [Helicobacter acinonychis]SFZ70868.1 OMP321 [Helicobacter acinonychis]